MFCINGFPSGVNQMFRKIFELAVGHDDKLLVGICLGEEGNIVAMQDLLELISQLNGAK